MPDAQADTQRPSRVYAAPLDLAGFAALLRPVYGPLRLLAAAEVGWTEADDVLQKTCVLAMRRLGDFTPGTNFRAWMASLLRGVAANHRRAEQRLAGRHRRAATAMPDDAPAGETNPALEAMRRMEGETSAEFEHALAALTDDQRRCLLLKVVMEHSYAQIAEITGLAEATARSHVFRARQRLLEILPPRGEAAHA